MVYNYNFVPWETIHFDRLPRRPGEKGNWYYAAQVCSFDIETTRLAEIEQGIMYQWQFAIGIDTVIFGRTWGEFKGLLWHLKGLLGDLHLLIYVHNLSYEFQYLTGIYKFRDDEVFCTEARKILKCSLYGRYEFRCSYILTNMSLSEGSAKYNRLFRKRSGEEYDYSKRRFSETPLTNREKLYCAYDVLAVVEMVEAILKLNDDDLYTIPLTSTGFVRRDIKAAMREYQPQMKRDFPPYRCYQLLKAAFRGGNTHANRFYAGEIISNVTSHDESSAYPAMQVNKKFPVGQFKECTDLRISQAERLIDKGCAWVAMIRMLDVQLRNKYEPVPYIPIAKCRKLVWYDKSAGFGVCNDNGRVLAAKYIEMCVTDIDYQIIMHMYSAGYVEFVEMYKCWYDYLPKPIRDKNIEYFRKKTELKGVSGQELYYMKNKNLLNSIYGMSVTDVLPSTILFDDLKYTEDTSKVDEDHYLKRANVAFTQYAYGVWTTAQARAALQAGIDLCGEQLVYVDTDSVKYVGDVDFSEYNNDRVQECLSSGGFADDPSGKRHYLGVYEFDGKSVDFCTLGAKKYAYTDEKGKLHITVSGVSKKRGAKELEAKGGLNAFRNGFIFHDSGKTDSVYNDTSFGTYKTPEGITVNITNNVVIRDTAYTIGLTDDYIDLLIDSAKAARKLNKACINCLL